MLLQTLILSEQEFPKNRDVLHDLMTKLRAKHFGIDLQFTNFRSN